MSVFWGVTFFVDLAPGVKGAVTVVLRVADPLCVMADNFDSLLLLF